MNLISIVRLCFLIIYKFFTALYCCTRTIEAVIKKNKCSCRYVARFSALHLLTSEENYISILGDCHQKTVRDNVKSILCISGPMFFLTLQNFKAVRLNTLTLKYN